MSTSGKENVKQEQSTIPVSREIDAKQSDDSLEFLAIDPDGDLLLRAGTALEGEKACEFRACSAALRRASPVWKAMLFGPWQEAKPAHGDWIVDFPEDKPWSFRVVLAMVHGSFDAVPDCPSLEQLHDILMLTDKYDMIRVIRPWVAAWKSVVEGTIPATGLDHIRRVHAAWQLGSEELLCRASRAFALNVSIYKSDDETRFYFGDQNLTLASDDHSGPSELMEIVLKFRLDIIQDYLDFYHLQVHRRTSNGATGCQTETLSKKYKYQYDPAALRKQHAECDLWSLGHIMQCLVTSGFQSLPRTAEEVTRSPSDLIALLGKMFPRFSDQAGVSSEAKCWYQSVASDHKDCSPFRKLEELGDEAGKSKSRATIRERYCTGLAAQRNRIGIQD